MHVEHLSDQHRFVARIPEGLAVLDYRLSSPKVMEMYHTHVPSMARGRGVAKALVAGALDEARANGFKIVPACWYVASFVEGNPAYQDLVDDGKPGPAPSCEIR